jgi:hypothetical protein
MVYCQVLMGSLRSGKMGSRLVGGHFLQHCRCVAVGGVEG